MLITIPIWVLNMIGKKIDRARHTQPFLFSVYLKLFYGTSTQGTSSCTRDKGENIHRSIDLDYYYRAIDYRQPFFFSQVKVVL